MSNKVNSIVTGDVNGRFSEVFGKLSTLHAKNNFAFGLVAGNFFADPVSLTAAEQQELNDLLDGKIEVPLTVYFSLGTRPLPKSAIERLESTDGELCNSLFILGRRASMKTSDGFRLVAVGGSYTETTSDDDTMNMYDVSYTEKDTRSLAEDTSEVDLLITSEWPADVSDGSRVTQDYEAPRGASSIANLCAKLKPRYHISTSEGFYEREPFFHPGPPPRHITRFISLAPFGNESKQKWIYAFSLEPSAPPPQALPDGCTAMPFSTQKKRKVESRDEMYDANFRYTNGAPPDRPYQPARRNKRRRNDGPPKPDKCFFCLSAETFAAHMVTSIGTDSFVTIAKGPLTTKETFPELGFPGHMLIIPLQHSPTLSTIEEEFRYNTIDEMHRYRNELHKMITTKSRGADNRAKLGDVTWEISRVSGVHLHWQFLPIATDLIQRGLVEAAFDVEAENLSYPKFVKDERETEEVEAGDYFKVMIRSAAMEKDKVMVMPIDSSFRFDLQFGRKVLAKLLGLENRIDWRGCAQEKVDEEADASAFAKAFEEYDFALNDE